jgi:hypothetical protein
MMTAPTPSISVNDNNQLIESHQQRAGHGYVDYRRGTLGQTSITFASPGISDGSDSNHPDVALTNNGVVVQAAATFSTVFVNSRVISRTGIFNDDPTLVNWSKSEELSQRGETAAEPSVATNGGAAVAVWTADKKIFWSIAPLP